MSSLNRTLANLLAKFGLNILLFLKSDFLSFWTRYLPNSNFCN